MAAGRLGASDLAATTNTSVYAVPSGKTASLSVRVCNRNAAAVTVRLALAATGTPGASEWLVYDKAIPANGVMDETGLVLDATKILVAYASTTGVNVVVFGYED